MVSWGAWKQGKKRGRKTKPSKLDFANSAGMLPAAVGARGWARRAPNR